MAETLAEKIIARAANRTKVCPGEIVTCTVDLAMMHDSGGPRRIKPILERLNARVWDTSKVVLVSDHYAPAVDPESAAILNYYLNGGIFCRVCLLLVETVIHLPGGLLAVSCSVLERPIWPAF